jgi:hypothetical protein
MKLSITVKILILALIAVIGWNYWLISARDFYNKPTQTEAGILHNVDFFAYYNAGARFLRSDNPYFWGRDSQNQPVISDFIYPPPTLPIFSLLARLPYDQARLLWLIGYGLSFIAILLWMVRSFAAEWQAAFLALGLGFTLVSFPLLSHIQHGQVDVFIISLILASYLLYARNKRLPAAILLALATIIKVSPVFLLIYYVVFQRDLRFLLMYLVSIVVLAAFSLIFVPFGWYIDYIRYVLPEVGKGDAFWLNQSLLKYLSSYPDLSRVVELCGLGMLAVTVWIIGRRFSNDERQSAIPLGKTGITSEMVFILNLTGILIFLGKAWVATYVWLILPSAWLVLILLDHKVKPLLVAGFGTGIVLVLAKVYGFPLLDSLNTWGGVILSVCLVTSLLKRWFLPSRLSES